MKLDRLCASKIAVVGQAQERDSHSNGERGEKEGAMGPEQVQNRARQMPLDLKPQGLSSLV